MANARIRTGGFVVNVDVVDLDSTERAFREVRARIARDADQEAAESARLTILPTARRRAGNLKITGAGVAQSLTIRRIRGGARLTTKLRGIRGRAVGLLEFGGKVRIWIRPKQRGGKTRHALMIPGSAHPISVVRTAREYRARRFMVGARDERLPAFADELRRRLVEFFRARGFEVD